MEKKLVRKIDRDVFVEIVDKHGRVIDTITKEALSEAANDPSNYDDSEIESSTVNSLGELDSEHGDDHSTLYHGPLILHNVESEKGENYSIEQDINDNDQISLKDSSGEDVKTKNPIDLTQSLSELQNEALPEEDDDFED